MRLRNCLSSYCILDWKSLKQQNFHTLWPIPASTTKREGKKCVKSFSKNSMLLPISSWKKQFFLHFRLGGRLAFCLIQVLRILWQFQFMMAMLYKKVACIFSLWLNSFIRNSNIKNRRRVYNRHTPRLFYKACKQANYWKYKYFLQLQKSVSFVYEKWYNEFRENSKTTLPKSQ